MQIDWYRVPLKAVMLILMILQTMTASPSQADEEDPPRGTWPRASLHLAFSYRPDNGRDDDLRAAFVAGGYDDNPCDPQLGCRDDLPSASTETMAGYFAIGCELSRRVEVRASRLYGGYLNGTGYDGSMFMDVDMSLCTWSLEGWFISLPVLRFGGGIAYHDLDAYGKNDSWSGGASAKGTGGFLGANVVVPASSVISGELILRYDFANDLAIGPLGPLPETKITVSGFSWMIGFGLRL